MWRTRTTQCTLECTLLLSLEPAGPLNVHERRQTFILSLSRRYAWHVDIFRFCLRFSMDNAYAQGYQLFAMAVLSTWKISTEYGSSRVSRKRLALATPIHTNSIKCSAHDHDFFKWKFSPKFSNFPQNYKKFFFCVDKILRKTRKMQ